MTEVQQAAENYLSSIKDKVKAFQSILLEIEALEYAASGMGAIRYDKEHVDGSSGEDRLIIFIDDALTKRAEAEAMSITVDELKTKCYQLIKRLPDADERIVLEWLYINARPMQEVMRKISVSERKAYYIKEEALAHFGELLTE